MNEVSLVVGCGYTGQRNLCRRMQVLALDIDKEKILSARKGDRHTQYVVSDARLLPVRPNCFEDIICTEVLEHVVNYNKLLCNIIRLKPHFICLSYPTEIKEMLLVKGSRIYREQCWGRIHVTTVDTRGVIGMLLDNGYNVHVELTSARSVLTRLILQTILEKLHIEYKIPDLGLVTFSENRRLYKVLAYISSLLGLTGYATYLLWKYLRVKTLHDSYILHASCRNWAHSA